MPKTSLLSIVIALVIAISILLLLMKLRAEMFLRIWFFIVVILALGVSINAFLINVPESSIIALAIAIPLAIFKVFKRNLIVHNLTELLIYPGIAAIFVPLLSIWTIVLLLLLISVYDMWAVWHSGIMQKMAKFQIEKVKAFGGFFIPYISKEQRILIKNAKTQKQKQNLIKAKKIKIPIAILGGGDVVFPLILAGVVLFTLGIIHAIIISLGATLSLAYLFYISKKGKFYPAMPFITIGVLIALGIVYLI